jgi:hypothetical protein
MRRRRLPGIVIGGDLVAMEAIPVTAARRRAIRVALRLGVIMLASGAQTREVERLLFRSWTPLPSSAK